MIDIPTKVPDIITIGDTLEWNIDDISADYPASAWTLTYYLEGPKPITIIASANGENFSVVVDASVTATWTEGNYWWKARVTEIATSRKFTVNKNIVKLVPDFSQVTGAFDGRDHVKKVLDAIEAVLEGRATKDQESYSIQNRSLARTPIDDLLKFRSQYKSEYEELLAKDKLANGENTGRTMRTKFI